MPDSKTPATLRVAFLGTGGISRKHTRNLKELGPDVAIPVAACDVNLEAVQKFVDSEFGSGDNPQDVPTFTDAAKMYAETQPDAVIICTPHTLHFDHCMQALENDCHVLVEKPMVTSATHARTLADKAEATGKILVVGYNTPCSAEFKFIRDAIRNKTFGELQLVNGYLTQGWQKGVQGSWRLDPKLSGGGQAYDSGAHLLNSLCWATDSDVEEVFAFVDNCGEQVDINSTFVIKFANKAMASIAVGGNCPSWGADLHFIFTDGRIDVDGWTAKWINVFGNKHEQIDTTELITPDMDAGSPLENFIDAIHGKAEPRTSPRNGIIQSDLMDAIYLSAERNTPVRTAAAKSS